MPTTGGFFQNNSGALIGAGAALLGGAYNAFSTNKNNDKAQGFTREMYLRELNDTRENTRLANEYNSPEQQMQRLQKAGLNPNLVYGNGATAGTSSTQTAPHAAPYRGEAPRLDLPQVVDGYQNTQMRQQQLANDKMVLQNMQTQNELLQLDKTKKALENQFFIDTLDSRKRGFLGVNEGNYQSGIQKLVTAQTMQAISGGSWKIHNGWANSVSVGDEKNLYVDQFNKNLTGVDLINELRKTANKGGQIRNKTEAAKAKYAERMYSGKMSDMSAKDWLQFALGLGNLAK